MSIKLQMLIEEKNRKVLKKEIHYFSRKTASGRHRKGENESYTVYICNCPNEGCEGTVRVTKPRELDSKCKKCADIAKRKRPYERTFNRAIYGVTLRNKEIKWLLSYEEFVSVCKIPNCHYCNKPLGRAAYAGDLGSDSILLDRKDSNKDYTLDNSVPCCPKCNFTKNDRISYVEMVLVMKHRGCWVEKE